MGYCTNYSLSILGETDAVLAAENDLMKLGADSTGKVDPALEDLILFGSAYATLYDLPEWISTVATNNPDVLFVLEGHGDDDYDDWQQRWKGKHFQIRKFHFDDFDEPLLIDYEKNNKN